MSITSGAPQLLRFSHAVNDALDKTMTVEPHFLSGQDKAETIAQLDRAEQRIHALKLKVLGVARVGDDACEAGGHRDSADLMAKRTTADRPKWAAEQRLAEALEQRWSATRQAWAEGRLSFEHARVIVRALDDLDDLPEVYADYVDAELLERAEAHLIGLAAEFTPAQVRRLGARMFEAIAPDAAEEIEARKLAAMEQRAEKAMGVTIRRNAAGIDGLTEVKLRVPDSIADRFSTYLQSFTNPRVTGKDEEDGERRPLVPFAHPDGQKIPQVRRLAMAFCQLLETLDPTRLPIHGGDTTHVVVTIGLDELRKDLAGADFGLGEDQRRISAQEVRRLACNAHIIPAVLGGDSEILDFGRSRRLFSRGQTRAMALRDQQCRADGCSVPATWCEAHHFGTPWSQGGQTDLADGRLLCRWHHQRAHDDRYLHQQMPNGDIRFSRRT